MENKKWFLASLRRDNYTWRNSIFVAILIFFLLYSVGTIVGFATSTVISSQASDKNVDFVETVADNFAFLGYWVITFIYLNVVKTDKPILRAIGTESKGNTFLMAFFGLLLGLLLNAICAIVAILHGDIHLSFVGFPLLKLLLIFVSVIVQGAGEELLCRGVLYQRIRKGYSNPWVAILVNPLIFVFVHLLIPGVTIWVILSIYFVGVAFGLMVYYLDSLWMAMAAHAAWNFSQSFIFGLYNDNIVRDFTIFRQNQDLTKTSLFYNGSFDIQFGIEGSVTSVILWVLTAFIVFYIGRKNNMESLNVWDNGDQDHV